MRDDKPKLKTHLLYLARPPLNIQKRPVNGETREGKRQLQWEVSNEMKQNFVSEFVVQIERECENIPPLVA